MSLEPENFHVDISDAGELLATGLGLAVRRALARGDIKEDAAVLLIHEAFSLAQTMAMAKPGERLTIGDLTNETEETAQSPLN